MKIFPKLFLMFLAIALVPLGIAALAISQRARELESGLREEHEFTSRATTRKTREALEEEATRALRSVVQEKAFILEDSFNDIRRSVLLQARLTRKYLSRPASPGSPPSYDIATVARMLNDPDHPFKEKHFKKTPYSIYQRAPGVPEETIRESVRRLADLGEYFAHNHVSLAWTQSTYVGHRDGFIFGYPGRATFNAEYDPRVRGWYKQAMKGGRMTWGDIYLDRNKVDVVITCSMPVALASGGEPVAVAAIDVKLTSVLAQMFDLRKLRATDAILMDPTGTIQVREGMMLEKTHVDDFQGGEYRAAFRKIRSNPLATYGFHRGAGTDGSLYAYSAVQFRTGETGERTEKKWYYIAKMPMKVVAESARRVEETLRSSNALLAAKITEKTGDLWNSFIATLIATLVFALALAYFTARSFSGPIVEVTEVAEAIGEGDLKRKTTIKSADEIGSLGKAINTMIDGLKERDRAKRTLKSYVSPVVAEMAMEKSGRLALGGDRRELTVFFTDIVDFTPLAEKMRPEKLVRFVNEYLQEMTEAVFEEAGTLDKYVGDAVMAFWGAPNRQPDHAVRACRCAMEQMERLKRLCVEWRKSDMPAIKIRVGINSGPMIVGNIGSESHMGYTVMGDAVNLGARLEAANKAYGTSILIGKETRRLAGDAIVAREIDRLTVPGRSESERVYELFGMAEDIDAAHVEGAALFEEGLKAYRSRDWDAAEKKFQEVIRLIYGDPVSTMFLRRIAEYRYAPPPPDWDGTSPVKVK